MDALQNIETLYVACAQCRAANLATAGRCSVCGARMREHAGAPRARAWREASVRRRLVVGGLIVGLLAWSFALASTSADSVLSAVMHYGYPVAYGAAALRAAVGAARMFRARAVSTGITLCALTVLLLLLGLATLAPHTA